MVGLFYDFTTRACLWRSGRILTWAGKLRRAPGRDLSGGKRGAGGCRISDTGQILSMPTGGTSTFTQRIAVLNGVSVETTAKSSLMMSSTAPTFSSLENFRRL